MKKLNLLVLVILMSFAVRAQFIGNNMARYIENNCNSFSSYLDQNTISGYFTMPSDALANDNFKAGAFYIPFANKYSTISVNASIDNKFLISDYKASLGYSYRLDFTRKIRANFGLGLNYSYLALNNSRIQGTDLNDPVIALLNESSLGRYGINANTNVSIGSNVIFGFWMNKLPSNYAIQNPLISLGSSQTLGAVASYSFELSNNPATLSAVFIQNQELKNKVIARASMLFNKKANLSMGYCINPSQFFFSLELPVESGFLGISRGINTSKSAFGGLSEFYFSNKNTSNLTNNSKISNQEKDEDLYTDEIEYLTDLTPTEVEYVFIIDTTGTEKVPIYNPDPNDPFVEIQRWDDMTRLRIGHDTSKIYFVSVAERTIKPGYYLVVKASNDESVIDAEIKRMFTLGVVSYKFQDPQTRGFYQYVNWTLDEVESSKQIQYFEKEFKYLWVREIE